MKGYSYTDKYGTFHMEKPEYNSYLYFPLAGESGLKSSITPLLGGDSKLDQNAFLLEPVSVENLHTSKSTRNFWCVLENGKCWSATGASAETEALRRTAEEEGSALDAGPMWHRISRTSKRYPLASVITSFVPCDKRTFEIMQVKLRNTGAEPVSFTPVAAIPFYARSADNIRDHRHVTSLLHRVRVTGWGVEVTPTLTFDERGHKKNTLTYFVYGADENGDGPVRCCPRTEDFIGEGGSLARPLGLEEEGNAIWKTAGSETAGGEAIGALAFRSRTLAPGEEAVYSICMGIGEAAGREELREGLMAEYRFPETAERALEKVQEEWKKKINVRFETGDQERDNFLYWVAFQPILRRMYGCSFLPYHDYGKGGRGWRDLWQDCLALLIMEPDGVRQMLLDNYRGVRMDGTNATIIGEAQGEFLADRNHIVRVWMDHGVWPFITTQFYIMQTGDISILAEKVPYFKDSQISRGEERDEEWEVSQGTVQKNAGGLAEGTVLEHILLQNITAFYDVGEHNHIRLRGADWNDAYDMAPERGESIAFTAAYAGNLEELAALMEVYAEKVSGTMDFQKEVCMLLADRADIYGKAEEKRSFLKQYYGACRHSLSGERQTVSLRELAVSVRGMADWIKRHIRETEWLETGKGSFYNGYYDNRGERLEGVTDGKVQMTLTSQVFPIMSGTATEEQIRQIVSSADTHLYKEEIGGYRLNTDFGDGREDMGRAFGFAYGHKENGAVFSHMTVMYANALLKRGFVREGFQALEALYRQAQDFEHSRIYPGLPEYFSDTGRGMYPYLTGSASWMLMTVLVEICGIRGEYGRLVFRPRLMKELLDGEGCLGVHMEFAGVPLYIRFETRPGAEVYSTVEAVWLDGELVETDGIAAERLQGGTGEREIKVLVRG